MQSVDCEELNRELEQTLQAFSYHSLLLDNVYDAVIGIDERLVIQSWNKSAAALFGWRAEEAVGQPAGKVLPLDFADLQREEIRQSLLSQGRAQIEGVSYTRGGQRYDLEANVIALTGADGTPRGFMISARDVTEQTRLRNEQLQAQSNVAELHSIYAHASVGLCFIDADLRYHAINEVLANLNRLPVEEHLGKKVSEVLTCVGLEHLEGQVRQVLETGIPLVQQEITGQPGGDGCQPRYWLVSYHPVSGEDGRRLGVSCVVQDITQARQSEASLRESERRYQALASATFEGIVISENGKILDVNEQVTQIFGYQPEELLGQEIGLMVAPEDRERVMDNARQELEGLVEHVGLRKDGSRVPIEARTRMIPYQNRAVRVTSVRDVTEQRRIIESLRESEERYSGLFHNRHSPMLLIDPVTAQIVDANPAASMFYGWSRAELTAMKITDINALSPEETHQEMSRAQSSATHSLFFFRHRLANGEIRDVEVHSGPLHIGGKDYLFSIIQDITERKRAEEALRYSEERFNKAFEASPNGQAISRQADGYILDINGAFEKIFGYRRAEVIGKTSLELDMYVDPDERQKFVQELREKQSVHDYELEMRTSSGEIIQASLSVVMIHVGDQPYMLTIIQDITERKRSEKTLRENEAHLRESEERFRQLADAMPQLVWTARPDGTVDYYNRRYSEYNGLAPGEGQSWEWGPVLHPDDLLPTMHAWMNSIQTGEIYQVEHRIQQTGGGYRWHLSRGIPVLDAQGRVARWYGTATDIHEQKQAEEKLKRSNHELEQFAFVASHDLQEPLRKIRVFGERLEHSLAGRLDGETQDIFQRMLSSASRMQVMIKDLLELSRVNTQTKPFVEVDLDQIASEVVSDLELHLQKTGGQVVLHSLPSIWADPMQMRQLLQNLIMNALKFQQPGTPPLVEVSAEMTRSASEGLPAVTLVVKDNGIGFDLEYLDRILQPFQRLHGRSEYEGTGMGLAICKRIVERHNGTLTAQSAPGQGAAFLITLPVTQQSG